MKYLFKEILFSKIAFQSKIEVLKRNISETFQKNITEILR